MTRALVKDGGETFGQIWAAGGGDRRVAAKHHQTIAEIYETDVADLEKAMHHYEQVRRTNA